MSLQGNSSGGKSGSDDGGNNRCGGSSNNKGSLESEGGNHENVVGRNANEQTFKHNTTPYHTSTCKYRCRSGYDHYNRWLSAYESYLKSLHEILMKNIHREELKIIQNIPYDDFCEFIYKNSSKFIY
jgi:hypothetical protein